MQCISWGWEASFTGAWLPPHIIGSDGGQLILLDIHPVSVRQESTVTWSKQEIQGKGLLYKDGKKELVEFS